MSKKRVLYAFGGISTLWSVCPPPKKNSIFNPDQFYFKLKALKEVFITTIFSEQKHQPISNKERTKQIKVLSRSALKKICPLNKKDLYAIFPHIIPAYFTVSTKLYLSKLFSRIYKNVF